MSGRVQPYKPGYRVLSRICDPFFDAILFLSTVEINAALLALKQLDSSNCSWRVYRMREVAREQLEDWRRDRLHGPHLVCSECSEHVWIELGEGVHAAGVRCANGHYRRLRRPERARLERVADLRWREGDASNRRWLEKFRKRGKR